MTTNLRDPKALNSVSPMALSAYARLAGWSKTETFGDYSDVYTSSQLPEIIIPRTKRLGDYAQVVTQLIEIFAQVADVEEVALYNDLVTADRDVTRVSISDGGDDGTVDLEQGADLVGGSKDMWLAAACSMDDPRPVYRAGANRDAMKQLRRIRIGQTERGSYVVTLLSPVIPPPIQEPLFPDMESNDEPLERRLSRRLVQALSATHNAAELANTGDIEAFVEAVPFGASANLCEALVQMIEPFEYLSVSTTWARTRPLRDAMDTVRFERGNAPTLREAARSFRSREPREDVRLFGFVQRLKRDESETDGTVTLRSSIDGRTQSVTAVLSESDYTKAIEAHSGRSPVIVLGDLGRFGQRWRLLNPQIAEVISGDDEENSPEDEQL